MARLTLSVLAVVSAAGLLSPAPRVARGQAPATWTALPDWATVGDTVYLSRTLPAPAGATLTARPLSRTPSVEPLADPVVEQRGNVFTVRYAVAVFEPGRQAIPMPSVEVFYADGGSEDVLGDTARVSVRSVLPAGDSLAAPRPALGPLPRPIRRTSPAVWLTVLALAGGGLWAVSRRRVGPRPVPGHRLARGTPPSVGAWAEAGELRAVATRVAVSLRRELARRLPLAGAGLSTEACLEVLRRERPGWPLAEIADVLHALDRARFAPAVPQDVLALAEQARMVVERLPQRT